MWDAQNKHFEATGRPSRGMNGYVYEIAYGPATAATAQDAIEAWLKSPAHSAVIFGRPPWDKYNLDHFGCGIHKKYADCYFQQKIKTEQR